MPTAQRQAIRDMMDSADAMLQANQEIYVNALLERYQEFERRISADILRIHTELFRNNQPSYSDFMQYQGDARVARTLASEIHRLTGNVNQSLLDELTSQYKDAYNVSEWMLDQSTPPNIEPVYKMPPENAIRLFVSEPWSGAMFSQRIGTINEFMAQDIQKAVTQAMLSGDSTYDLAKRISSVIGTPDSDYMYRSKVIARTELLRSANQIRSKVWRDNKDLMEGEVWVTRALTSARLCDDCAERAGLGRDEVEELADEQDLEVDPPAHPNCGCTWMPKVKSWEELMAPKFGGSGSHGSAEISVEELEPMSFSEWQQSYVTSDQRGNL